MLSCQEVTRLVSESLDNNSLTFWQRMQVRLHLLMCSLCSRFRTQAEFLRQAARKYAFASEDDATGPSLPDAARKRIKDALKSGS
jgi:Putative zinc-finger